MQGLFANPVVEGIVLILLGIGCYVAGTMIKDADLHSAGGGLLSFGLGYLSHTTVQAAKQ